jgi:hypothetical protein
MKKAQRPPKVALSKNTVKQLTVRAGIQTGASETVSVALCPFSWWLCKSGLEYCTTPPKQ